MATLETTSSAPQTPLRLSQVEPPERRTRRRVEGGVAGVLSVNGILVIGVAYMVLPLLWLAFAATKNAQDIYGTSAFSLGEFALFSNIADVLAEDGGVFLVWIVNSLLYAGVGAALGALISVMAGYAFDKIAFRFKGPLYGLVLVGVLVPTTATSIPLYLLAAQVNLTNTFWSVFLPVLCFPFAVYLARIFSAGYIPNETLEAAKVDGAGPIRTFVSIALPMMVPGYVTIFLFSFVAIWNNFMLPLVMLTDRSLFPVSLGMSTWQSYVNQQPEFAPLVITGSALSLIPLLIAFISLQKFWRSGLTAGSVK